MTDPFITTSLITLIVISSLKLIESLVKRVQKSSCINEKGAGVEMTFKKDRTDKSSSSSTDGN
jgi:hypothetical protein